MALMALWRLLVFCATCGVTFHNACIVQCFTCASLGVKGVRPAAGDRARRSESNAGHIGPYDA
jgi:hypothetical protein